MTPSESDQQVNESVARLLAIFDRMIAERGDDEKPQEIDPALTDRV